ncbi:hypothetical protein TRAPUB_540 [Trametes pubescens]|uniref:BTB domain-containing protein n=1 Tax=Trametes pubescens TaxID=154538 RepID=A0A1M2VLP3_TRAPU|nr:hypothetical protein TRAPUB_540 [Trametes pubescens]
MSGERPCKRTRREDIPPNVVAAVDCRAESITATDALAKPGPTRDKDVWLSTGNLIIVASGRVAFRIFRGLLAIKSEVFRGLFELPPPPDHEKMDGCPVVELSDSPDDLKHLFLVMYYRKK